MSISLLPNQRIRKVLVALATVTVLGIAPTHASANSDGGSASLPPTSSTTGASPTSTLTFRDSLEVGTPVWTGAYKTVISGPHTTQVKVYKRSFHACDGQVAGLIQNCQGGTIVYAAGFAACFETCTVGGQRGSHYCQVEGSDSNGASSAMTACYSDLLSNGYASKGVETDRDCVSLGCSSYTWHVNAYPTGNITGPYEGTGNV
jgi:hypothetical protein